MRNRIKEIRIAAGLSQSEVAERAGTTKVQISRLEKGDRRLTHDWMLRLAKALDCQIADLISDEISSDPKEQAMLEMFRQLTPEQKDAMIKLLNTMAQSDVDLKAKGNG